MVVDSLVTQGAKESEKMLLPNVYWKLQLQYK